MKVDPNETVLPGLRRARKLVVIAVNALRFREVDWDRSPAPPDTDILTDQMWSIPVDRISLDTVEQVNEKLIPARTGTVRDGTSTISRRARNGTTSYSRSTLRSTGPTMPSSSWSISKLSAAA